MGNYTALDNVPKSEIRSEMPDRAMAFSAATNQLNLVVNGAQVINGQWKVDVAYIGVDGKYRQGNWPSLKRTSDDRLYATLDLGKHPQYGSQFRDVYLTKSDMSA